MRGFLWKPTKKKRTEIFLLKVFRSATRQISAEIVKICFFDVNSFLLKKVAKSKFVPYRSYMLKAWRLFSTEFCVNIVSFDLFLLPNVGALLENRNRVTCLELFEGETTKKAAYANPYRWVLQFGEWKECFICVRYQFSKLLLLKLYHIFHLFF